MTKALVDTLQYKKMGGYRGVINNQVKDVMGYFEKYKVV
jgi:hypothetical protein